VDIIGLEVGYRLIPLVDRNQGGQMMDRIKGVRKKLSQELGFLVQPVHIRDNLELSPNAYRILLMGVPVGEAEVHPEMDLAINPGRVFGTLQGIATKDPAFGLDAVWIEASQRENAQAMGYTVVDASTVVATHLSQLLQEHAHELIGHEEVQQLLDLLAKNAPKLVEDLVPGILPLGVVLKVLQNLLADGCRCATCAPSPNPGRARSRSQDPGVLTAACRVRWVGRLSSISMGWGRNFRSLRWIRRWNRYCNSPCKAVPRAARASSPAWRNGCTSRWRKARSGRRRWGLRPSCWCRRASGPGWHAWSATVFRTCMCWPTTKYRTTNRSRWWPPWDRVMPPSAGPGNRVTT
jgi:hypothetical protein